MSGGCCGDGPELDGSDAPFRRALWAVIAINAVMFVVEMAAGQLAGSQALKADALDFAADTATYAISLAVLGASLRVRAMAALGKGTSLLIMGGWVFGSTVWQALGPGLPEAEVMGVVGFLALAANLASVLILLRFRDGDANVRSVWLCSRNDAIGNVAVVLAAAGVFGTGTAWPDLLVAGIMSALFLAASASILRQAFLELQQGGTEAPDRGKATSDAGEPVRRLEGTVR